MPKLSFEPEQLIEDAQEFLDLDPRFWDQREGSFTYYDANIIFSKEADFLTLEVAGLVLTVSRFN